MRPRTCPAPGRSGITLTEILISILILGVGLISIATLFPIGLLRLRAATRLSRSAYLVESAAADLEARNLFAKTSFKNPLISPWYFDSTSTQYDPWVQDTSSSGTIATGVGVIAKGGFFGPGLPVAYDPLWRTQTNTFLTVPMASPPTNEARFGSGAAFQIRTDPDGQPPSAWGLQRITNLNTNLIAGNTITPPGFTVASTPFLGSVADVFVSPEDFVTTEPTAAAQAATGVSPVLPQLTNNGAGVPQPVFDWRYSWIFTGYQADASNDSVYDGEIVVFENRQFGFDQSANGPVAAGETVVEAVFACDGTPTLQLYGGPNKGRAVLLRWPSTQPDPEIKVGDWFADVTYERNAVTDANRLTTARTAAVANPALPVFPNQRCYWYQVAKKGTVRPDPLGDVPAFRSVVVYTTTPLRAWTTLNTKTGFPLHNNVAFISSRVVNVFPRTIYTR